MEENDKEFEKYLGEFQPRRPRVLPATVTPLRMSAGRLAAAAAILTALGITFWSVRHKSCASNEFAVRETISRRAMNSGPGRLSTARLTQMALEDPKRFGEELENASRRMLPDFRGKDSTLRVLAKE